MEIDTAIEILPFATYVIETDQYLSEKIKRQIEKNLYNKSPTNTFIILDGGMKIAKHRKEDGSKEEGLRESDINEHIESDWAVGTEEADNEEGSVSALEHLIQHIQTWEDYLRMEREARVRGETEGEETGESGIAPRDKSGHNGIFNW